MDTIAAEDRAWWQSLVDYGVRRAVDAEFLLPYQSSSDEGRTNMTPAGRVYTAGQPAPGSQQVQMPLVLLIAGVGLLVFLLKD